MSDTRSIASRRKKLVLFASVIALPGLFIGAGAARAQSADPAATGGDIIVTAQKRAERLQDVPVAVTAITSADLQKRGINTTEDLSRAVPALNFTELSPGQLSLSARGLTNAYGLFPTVSYYVDETPFDLRQDAQSGTPAVDLFDAQRVEFLSGPQGTLYGSASMGGAVRIVLNQPDPTHVSIKMEGSAVGLDGAGSGYDGKIAINMPILANLAVRLTATQQLYPGYTTAIRPVSYYTPSAGDQTIERNSNTSERTSFRLAAAWTPDSTWTITPSLFWQQTNAQGFNYSDQNRSTPYNYARDFVDSNITTLAVGNLEIKKDLGFAQVVSSSSYTFMYEDSKNDYDAWSARHYVSNLGGKNVGTPPIPNVAVPDLPTLNYEPIPYSQYTEELRITSPDAGYFNGMVSWIAGGYFNSLKEDERQLIYSQAYGNFYANLKHLPLSGNIFDYRGPTLDTQYAGFASVTLKPIPMVEITGGFRYYDLEQQAQIYYVGGVQAGSNVPLFKGQETGVTPRFNIDVKPIKDISVYATAAQGYRPGGANTALVPIGSTNSLSGCSFFSLYNQSYQPDSVWNYEVGEKAQFLDRKITLNSDVYEVDWSNIQGSLGSTCGTFIANFGGATIRGVESNLDWKVTSNVSLYASVAANHAAYSSLKAGVGPALGITTGERPVNTPDLKYTTGGQWDYVAFGLPIYARADAQFVGGMRTSLANYNNSAYITPGYTNLDISVGGYFHNAEIQFFIKNLTNKVEVYQIAQSQTQTYAENVVAPPRTFGVTLRYSMR